MRNKLVASFLALLLGVFGIHRLYLGQYLRGLLYLIYPVVVLTLIFQLTGSMDIIKEQATLTGDGGIVPFLLLFLLIPIFDFIWLLVMKREKFDKNYNRHSATLPKTILLSFLVLAGGAGFNYLMYQQLYMPGSTEVSGAPADITTEAGTLAAEFTDDESAARKKYEENIIELTGAAEAEETELGKGGSKRVLLLAGDGNLAVRCEFAEDEQEKVQAVEIGESITVKGTFREVMVFDVVLENCRLVESGD